MSTHARLGPSNAKWPHCAGSVREEERYPDVPGEAAIDGTGSHLLLEMCLQNNVPAAQYDREIIGANHDDSPNGWLVDASRCERVQMCLDYITRRVAELKEQYPGSTVTVEAESKSDPGGAFGRDDWWGTVDVTIVCRASHTGTAFFVEVVDYKDGRGYVSEKGNTQLLSYLFGKLRKYIASGPLLVRPFNTSNGPQCRVTIVQPKTTPTVRYACSTRVADDMMVADVVRSAETLSLAAHATDDPNAPLTAGKHCQWCKANPKRGGHCTANAEKSIGVVMDTQVPIPVEGSPSLFEIISKALADPKALTVDQLADMADAEDGLMQAFVAVKAEIKERIDQGDTVPGYAMQPGNSSNVWSSDEETIVKMLKSRRLKNADIYPPKLISPAQVMKLVSLTTEQRAKIERDHISNIAGKLTLKKVSRVADEPTAELMFGEVPELSFL